MEFSAVNTIWVLVGAALVFFMQAGFAMVETGFTRAKNAGNIIMKNLMDFAIGTPLYWLTGFGIMFAGSGAFIGGFDPFVRGDYSAILPAGVPLPAYLIFQTVFCATAATIVSGAMAERTKFISYCIYSAVISAIVYPISGHWIWGGGWLAQLGFHDFAGSCAIHMVGGLSAFIGATIEGARIGKFTRDENGKVYLANDGYIPCHVFENYDEIPYLVVPASKEFNGGIENLELSEAYSRIKTIVNGTLEEITSYNQLENQ